MAEHFDHAGELYECSCGGVVVVRWESDMRWEVAGETCPIFERWIDRRRREVAAALPRATARLVRRPPPA